MNDAEYVLCKRKERLWPAKVLTRDWAATKQQAHKEAATHLWVEILGLNEQTRVPFEDVELLTEEAIERITVQLGHSGKCHDIVEELTYRRVLREALDYLSQAAPGKEISPLKMGRSKTVPQKETKERSSMTRVAGRQLPSSQKDMQRRRGKTCETFTVPDVVGTQNKPSRRSRQTTEGSSSAKPPTSKSRVLLGNGELEGRPHQAPKTKAAAMPKKDVRLKSLSRPPASRRSPRFSKADERYRECKSSWERSSPSYTSKCFARTSTPARSSRSCAKLTPGKKCSGKAGLRRNLLGSPVKCPSAEEVKDLSEKEAFPPRKYSKDLDGQRHPQESEGTPQEQTLMASSLCWEGKCVSHHKGPPSSSGPVGPVLDGIQEEGPCLCPDRPEHFQCCDLEGKGLESPSDPVLRLSPISESHFSSTFRDEEEAEDEEELPRIFLHQGEQRWVLENSKSLLAFQECLISPSKKVKSVMRKAKKAIVHLIEKSMDDKKSKGFSISLKKLKHFDCEEKQTLIDKARESYQDEINWCINLIVDYRIRVGCRSFTGTFLEYCADDISYSVRKETHLNLSQMSFPHISEADSEEPSFEATPTKPAKKVLPDRTRAARDKANKKIVEFIVNARGADEHLRAILKSKKPSRWLKEFLSAPPYLTCIETYLEDDCQQDLVVNYLEKVYQEVNADLLPHINGNSIKFILDVLFPEAIIYAISAVDRIDYKKAEEKYIRGPLLSQRERLIFEEEILEKKRKQRLQQESPFAEGAS